MPMILAFAIALFITGATPLSGQLAFVAGAQQEDQRVFVMNLQTGAASPVGPGKNDGPPAWSPDGAWLAFETASPTGVGIYVVRPDGSEGRLLNTTHKWNQGPRWSPDSASLAYSADDDEAVASRVIVYNLASGTETPWGSEQVHLVRPVWLPTTRLINFLKPDQQIQWGDAQIDMTKLADVKSAMVAIALNGGAEKAKEKEKEKTDKEKAKEEPLPKLSTDIYIVTADLATPLPVLPSRGHYSEWAVEPAPSGEALAFESNDGGDREIFVLNKKGCSDVSNHRADDWNPTWAWNSQWLAFESFRDGRRGIYRVYAETARILPIAVTPDADNWWPTWSPDSQWIAFVSTRAGSPQIFVTDLAGNSVQQLTKDAGNHLSPAWQPKPKKKK